MRALDRSEQVDGLYRFDRDELTLASVERDVPPWSEAKLEHNVARVRGVLESGGTGFGAWDGNSLVGIATLHPGPIGGDPKMLMLDFLHVTRTHRVHGIGKALINLVLIEA